MKKILFLCTGNSCRRQMAEGWAHKLLKGKCEAYSAGVETHGMNPRAVRVMQEAGVDISQHQSKLVDQLPPGTFDCVYTVCDHAAASCPSYLDTKKTIHIPFDDPPKLTADLKDEEQVLAVYRRVRDEIRQFVSKIDE